jgi:undecaprenyl-diphosphatase
MNALNALILGLVQGLTEFLPVSSKSHLVFADHFLHLHLDEQVMVSFDVLLHLATALAVIIFMRREVGQLLGGLGALITRPRQAWADNPFSRLAVWLLLGTVPAAVIGLKFADTLETLFKSVPLTAGLLLITAVMLFLISRFKPGTRSLESATWKDALVIGLFQMCAVMPGISRSGTTITGGLLCGLDRESAPRFSFLLAIPVILGGGVKSIVNLSGSGIPLSVMAVGFLAAAVSGYIAVALLLNVVKKGRLDYFAYYCVLVSIGMLAYWNLLVPRADVSRISGLMGPQTLAVSSDGTFGPLTNDRAWTLSVPVHTGLAQRVDMEVFVNGHPVPIQGQQYIGVAGKGRVDLELRPLSVAAPVHAHPGGEPVAVWLVLRNAWGIRNDVPLKVQVVPPTAKDHTS